MSIFGTIMNAIFGKANAQAAPAGGAAEAAGSSTTPAAAPGAPPAEPVDVEKVVGEMAAKKKEKLDWRKSIVDLMKVLDLDSSLSARKELAQELGYTGQLNGSAEMNIWLHNAVMKKLAENGGKVPADLKD
jgi:3-oxoacyl-ACP reductase-like protein